MHDQQSSLPNSETSKNLETSKSDRYFSQRDGKIPPTVWQIGCMMFLMNLSYVIAYSFSGIYIKQILGTSAFLSIGVLEGLCETVSYLMKLTSGLLSDILKKRKIIMIIGYSFSLVSKPLLGFSSTFGSVFIARIMERFGNGIQASPRDAVVADVAPRKKIGASYGLKRSLAYAGSLIGGLLGIKITRWLNYDFPKIFLIASIPAFIAFFILIFGVKEPKSFAHPAASSNVPLPASKLHNKFSIKNFKYLGSSFWVIIIVNAIFMISRMNEQFLILRCTDKFVSDIALAPTVMIVMNLGAICASYPIGIIGDKLERTKMIFISVVFLCLADMVMYLAKTELIMYLGIFLWGIQIGASQNVFYALIAEKVPEDLRGTGLGIYWFVNAIAALMADSIAGLIAHTYSLKYVFVSSGIIGAISLIVLIFLMRMLNPSVVIKK